MVSTHAVVRAVPFTELSDRELAKSLDVALARLSSPDATLRHDEPWPAIVEASRRLKEAR